MSVQRSFVSHALALDWAEIAAPAQRHAKLMLHDTLAVGIAGAVAAYSDRVSRAVDAWSGGARGVCGVLGRPDDRRPAPDAAFLNAFQIHAQEYDAVHEAAVVHPMATVVATLLAALDSGPPVSGRAALTALCAGVDIAVGLGVAATTPLRFFRPATAGIFGSVAALIALHRPDPETADAALGLALAFAGGTMQAHLEGLPALPLQIAGAARGAVQAFELAKAGMPGPRGAIDGPFGYLPLFEAGHDLTPVLAELRARCRIAETSWKPFPTGRAAHGGIVAVQQLMHHQGLTPDNLRSLVYRAPPIIGRLVGRAAFAGMGVAHARLCLPYLAAVTLTRGTVGLGDFDDASRADPALLALAARVRVEVDGNPDPAAFVPAVATASTHDGRTFDTQIVAQLGSPALPLTLDQHLAKAASCLASAGMAHRARTLAAAIDALDDAPDAATALNAVLRPPIR